MACVSLLHRPLTALVLSASLVACTTDVLAPSARIDGGARVSAIEPVRSAARPRQEMAAAYPSDEPVAASSGNVVPANPGAQAGGDLPMIDSEPMPAAETQMASAAPMTVPPEGINMDSMLGVEPVVGLAEEQ
ncbi:extensin, partial [Sinorhizobium sp. 6-117]|nr:extensin [Sinorhizobium sp. 6-117]